MSVPFLRIEDMLVCGASVVAVMWLIVVQQLLLLSISDISTVSLSLGLSRF
jgi:hypothetical protein